MLNSYQLPELLSSGPIATKNTYFNVTAGLAYIAGRVDGYERIG